MLDSYPVNPGHTLIIPKKHTTSLFDLDIKAWNNMFQFNRQVIEVINKTDLKTTYAKMKAVRISEKSVEFLSKAINSSEINKKPDAYNFGINDGRSAGRTVDHLHWHIIPRYEGDMDDPQGGVRHVIPERGNYKK